MRPFSRILCILVMLSSVCGAAYPSGVTNSGASAYTNRLIHSRNPYLLLHAHDPVDWYPWGPEALEKARTENKLIFLSV